LFGRDVLESEEKTREFGHGLDDLIRLDAMVAMRSIALGEEVIATMDLVLDLAGGIITTMTRKLRVFQNDMRESQQQPSWGEWFEWLGDQAEKIKTKDDPAHVKHRSTSPPVSGGEEN
jgi:hypothetical protein